MAENMRMYRAKKGLDAFFDDRKDLTDQLEEYLAMLQKAAELDPDFLDDKDLEYLKSWEFCSVRRASMIKNAYDTPFGDPKIAGSYKAEQTKEWKKLVGRRKAFEKKNKEDFPTKKGKLFR